MGHKRSQVDQASFSSESRDMLIESLTMVAWYVYAVSVASLSAEYPRNLGMSLKTSFLRIQVIHNYLLENPVNISIFAVLSWFSIDRIHLPDYYARFWQTRAIQSQGTILM
jgi:hypothetical protein